MSYYSRTINPQQSPSISSYFVYAHDKSSRIQVQNQKKQLASNVNYLHRKAKQCAKNLNKAQLNLYTLYSKRMDQYDQYKKKSQFKKMEQEKLRELKNISSLNRYLHSLRKQESSKDILRRNQMSAKNVKETTRLSQQKMKTTRQSQLYNLNHRNQQSSRIQKNRNQASRQYSFNYKRKLSATVNGTLKNQQNKLIDRQMDKISQLTRKQKQLIDIVERSKKQREKVQGKIQKTKDMQYQQIYSQILTSSRKKNNSKKSKQSSNSKIYLDFVTF